MLDEFYRVAFRKKIYGSISELQGDLDDWVKSYNEERPHQWTMVLRQNADPDVP
jgi:Integrase core domain